VLALATFLQPPDAGEKIGLGTSDFAPCLFFLKCLNQGWKKPMFKKIFVFRVFRGSKRVLRFLKVLNVFCTKTEHERTTQKHTKNTPYTVRRILLKTNLFSSERRRRTEHHVKNEDEIDESAITFRQARSYPRSP